MPINVIPSWLKYFVMATILTICCWSVTGTSDRTKHDNTGCLASHSESGDNMSAKVGANIRQFVSNPLEPARGQDSGTVILRDAGNNYYQDEP